MLEIVTRTMTFDMWNMFRGGGKASQQIQKFKVKSDWENRRQLTFKRRTGRTEIINIFIFNSRPDSSRIAAARCLKVQFC